jgi:hypothetical protein
MLSDKATKQIPVAGCFREQSGSVARRLDGDNLKGDGVSFHRLFSPPLPSKRTARVPLLLDALYLRR